MPLPPSIYLFAVFFFLFFSHKQLDLRPLKAAFHRWRLFSEKVNFQGISRSTGIGGGSVVLLGGGAGGRGLGGGGAEVFKPAGYQKEREVRPPSAALIGIPSHFSPLRFLNVRSGAASSVLDLLGKSPPPPFLPRLPLPPAAWSKRGAESFAVCCQRRA